MYPRMNSSPRALKATAVRQYMCTREQELQTFSMASDQAVDDCEYHETLRLYEDLHFYVRKYSATAVKICEIA